MSQVGVEASLHKFIFYVVPSMEETSIWPSSMVFISVIIAHYKLHYAVAGP